MTIALTTAELEMEAPPRSVPGEIDALTLEACRRGDRRALRQFVLIYQRPVFAFIGRMTGRGAHVEDLAQEVFVRAYRALPRFEQRNGARVSTWLLKIAVRLVQDERRKVSPRLVELDDNVLQEPMATASLRPTPETEHRRREIARDFQRAAEQLSDEQRVVFVLAQFHGLTMTQIAELVGAGENTVKTRLHRARMRLRELLSEWSTTSGVAK